MVEIIKDVENKLLQRREVIARVPNTTATPTRAELRKVLAKKLKVDENLVVVNYAKSYYGNPDVNVRAKIYESVDSLNKNARPHMVKRNTAQKAAAEE